MLKDSNHQIIDQNIFTQAGHLWGNNGYTEKEQTAPYKNCDRLFVNHVNKTYWFTTQSHLEHTLKLANQ